jgi:endonuclease/exonuclease/phosphatase family metal-dependent hydrolase
MELTVATWNVWTRAGDYETRKLGIPPTLEAVSADVVGLVEVWRDGDELQIHALADELGYAHWAYADVFGGSPDQVAWGVGILSRFPIEERQHFEFPNPVTYLFGEGVPGVALLAAVRSPVGLFDVVCLCEWGLTWCAYGVEGSSDRLSTYAFLARKLRERATDIAPIVVGDFNAIPETRDLRALTGKDPHAGLAMSFMDAWESVHGGQGGWTFDGLANPHIRRRPFGRHRIDYILTGGGQGIERLWRTNDAAVFGQSGPSDLPPSDHYGVRAELELVTLYGEPAS